MPGSREDLETSAWDRFGSPVGMGNWNDSIPVAPDDQGRKRLGQVQPVVSAHPLAGDIDHRPDGVDECLLAVTLGQCCVATPYFCEGVARLPSHPSGKTPGNLAYLPDAPVEEHRKHVLGARQGARLEQWTALLAESTRRHQH